MVGPFIFFDHMGPAVFPPGKGVDVRPHPHIGLATVTYLFEGAIVHRDSLGYVQAIQPGAVNLMTAGRGIVHSERTGAERAAASRLHGIQSWMALPAEREESDPAFIHYPAAALPQIEVDGCTVRVIMGSAFGQASPVAVQSPTLYLESRFVHGTTITLPNDYPERAVYVVAGKVLVTDQVIEAGAMAVLGPVQNVTLQGEEGSRVMVLGGEALGERDIWWNFVASTSARIERAKEDWRAGRFGKVQGDDEFIPLPDS